MTGDPVDIANIVPSTRDLFQVLSTRRKKLAVVALVDDAGAGDEAARLDEIPVSAFAVTAPSDAMKAVAAATRSVPVLSLAKASDAAGSLAARAAGADGVVIAAGLEAAAWEGAASAARSTRMLPLATVASRADLDLALAAGARAALLRAPRVDEAIAWASAAPRGLVLLAAIDGASLEALASLSGAVDAVLVPPALHRAPGFAEFVASVDP